MKTTLDRRSQTIDKKLGSKWSVLTQYNFRPDSNLLLITPENCAFKTVVLGFDIISLFMNNLVEMWQNVCWTRSIDKYTSS